MMTLADILRARAASQGRTAQVECGELGLLTVEALPLREIELLFRGPDGDRAVFYAACRELQQAGEELRRAGQLYQPDGILQFVSGSEAETAARTVLELSGWQGEKNGYPEESPRPEDPAEHRFEAGTFSENPDEIRLPSVQNIPSPEQQDRPGDVRNIPPPEQQDRPGDVRNIPPPEQQEAGGKLKTGESGRGSGQDSREFFSESAKFSKIPESDKKAQGLGIFPFRPTQNVVSGQFVKRDHGAPGTGEERPLHEAESEFSEGLHESKSEISAPVSEGLHETESDFGEAVHESKSELTLPMPGPLHESASEFNESLHETRSEFVVSVMEPLHETESDFPEKLHETESELAEGVARRLLEGLKRAAAAR